MSVAAFVEKRVGDKRVSLTVLKHAFHFTAVKMGLATHTLPATMGGKFLPIAWRMGSVSGRSTVVSQQTTLPRYHIAYCSVSVQGMAWPSCFMCAARGYTSFFSVSTRLKLSCGIPSIAVLLCLSPIVTSFVTSLHPTARHDDTTVNATLCGCPILAPFQILNAEKIASGEKKPPDYFAPDEEFPMSEEDEFEEVTVSIPPSFLPPLFDADALKCSLARHRPCVSSRSPSTAHHCRLLGMYSGVRCGSQRCCACACACVHLGRFVC